MLALAGTVMFSVSDVGLLTVILSTENSTSGTVASTALVSPCTQLVLLPTTCSTWEKPCGKVLGVTNAIWADEGETLKLNGKSLPPEVRITCRPPVPAVCETLMLAVMLVVLLTIRL